MAKAILAALCVAAILVPSAPAHHSKAKGYRAVNAGIIHHVFGRYGSQAVEVARCESGLSQYAYNGQYLGMFQMGSYARSRYGHSHNNVWTQARAAYRYFVDSGRDWSPWSCKPW